MSVVVALTLSVFGQTEEAFPLKIGSRWTYVQDGKESMSIEVMGKQQSGSIETVQARIRGREFFLYSQEDVWLTTGEDGLRIHANGNTDRINHEETPLLLLAARLEKGKSWQSSSSRKLSATVRDLEVVRVPAGEFKAWKVDYLLTGASGAEYSFRAWCSPGTGFVRIELSQQVLKGEKKPGGYLLELSRYEAARRITPLPVQRLSVEESARAESLIDRLAKEEVEARENVVKELVALGRGVLPLLRARAEEAKDRELRGRLEQALGKFPKVEFVARKLRAGGKVGEVLPVEFVLRNIYDRRVQVLPSLGGASRYPRYSIVICNEKEEVQKSSKASHVICAFENPIDMWDFVTLEPGEECNPFGPGSMELSMHPWIPQRPGTYTLTAVYDGTGEVPNEWKGSVPQMDPRSQRLLELMPRGRFETNRLTVVVEP